MSQTLCQEKKKIIICIIYLYLLFLEQSDKEKQQQQQHSILLRGHHKSLVCLDFWKTTEGLEHNSYKKGKKKKLFIWW